MKPTFRKRTGILLISALISPVVSEGLFSTIETAMTATEQKDTATVPGTSPSTSLKGRTTVSSGESRDFFFPNIDIRSAFKAVAAAGNLDIVLSPKITGRVTLRLSDKSWNQALAILCQMMNLKYSQEHGYIYVQSISEFNKLEKEAQLIKKILKIRHTKAVDMEPVVNGLLSERGKLTLVETSNALIVTDLPSKITEIKEAIRTLDIETYQVHIQAQIIEINSKDAQEMGINWAYSSASAGGFQDASGKMAANIPPSNDFVGISSPGKVSGSSFSLAFGFLKGKLGGTIENLLSEGRGEVVAKPQITTLDNTEAKIFIGQKLPYNKLDDQYNATTEFVEAGIQLIVTPHITNDNKIILDLAPQRSAANIDPVTRGPIVTTTEAKTTVVVDDGQTVVIGGLTSKTENEIEKGIPFLKDIPLLGIFFRYKKTEVVKNDLIIFITPFIVKSQAAVLQGRQGNKIHSQPNRFTPVEPSPMVDESSVEFEGKNPESGLDDLSSDYQKTIVKDKDARTFSPETGEEEESQLDFPFFE